MPTLDSYNEDKPLKMLLIGASGSGKTGALASLANAGYKLRILDYDNGLDVLPQFIQKDKLTNVAYSTLTDNTQLIGDRISCKGMPTAFQRGLKLLNDWKPEGESESLGKAAEWGRDTVIVIDSLTFMGHAALSRVLFMNGRLGGKPEIQDWGDAMRQLEDVLAILYSENINCHVVVLTHITFVENNESMFGFPSALGSKLPPKVGRYFNHTLQADVIGSGSKAQRVLRTKPSGLVDIKCPLKDAPATLPLGTGLAEYFKLARG